MSWLSLWHVSRVLTKQVALEEHHITSQKQDFLVRIFYPTLDVVEDGIMGVFVLIFLVARIF